MQYRNQSSPDSRVRWLTKRTVWIQTRRFGFSNRHAPLRIAQKSTRQTERQDRQARQGDVQVQASHYRTRRRRFRRRVSWRGRPDLNHRFFRRRRAPRDPHTGTISILQQNGEAAALFYSTASSGCSVQSSFFDDPGTVKDRFSSLS